MDLCCLRVGRWVCIVFIINKYVLSEVSTMTYFCVHVVYVQSKLVTGPLTCLLMVPRCMQGTDCFRQIQSITAFSESCTLSFHSQLPYFYIYIFLLQFLYKCL